MNDYINGRVLIHLEYLESILAKLGNDPKGISQVKNTIAMIKQEGTVR